ncbi:uncharacterized [Tachysurus ichikawai]
MVLGAESDVLSSNGQPLEIEKKESEQMVQNVEFWDQAVGGEEWGEMVASLWSFAPESLENITQHSAHGPDSR